MAHFNGPRPPYRWQLGQLLPGLSRRLIPAGFCDLAPRRADDPLAEPVGQAYPRQGGRLPYQGVMLRQESNPEGGGVGGRKKQNLRAALALYFAYYNFVRMHKTIRMTPAMAAGIARKPWSVADLMMEVMATY